MSPLPSHTWIAAAIVALVSTVTPLLHASDAPGIRQVSARGVAGRDADALVVGFVVEPGAAGQVLVRGVGPALADYGVSGALADAALFVYGGRTFLGGVDDWGAESNAAQIAAAAATVGAFPLKNGSLDAALIAVARPGPNTGLLFPAKAAAPGVALAEVYAIDSESAPRRWTNVSARGRVSTGEGVLVAGFALRGTQPVPVLLRGVGPGLGAYGVTDFVGNPRIALYRAGATTALLQNDDWAGTNPVRNAAAAVGAFPLATASADAALVTSLDPGSYTVQLAGVGGTAGVGLIEVFDLTAAPPALPVIALQPAPIAVNPGAYASLSVVASSYDPLTYQWTKDGAVIAGATADGLVFPAVRAQDAGIYGVVITNRAGSVASSVAAVTVKPARATLPGARTFDLVGFATLGAGTSGGGVVAPGDANYKVLDASVTNKAQQLRTWLESTGPLVVDVQVDVDLGALNNVSARPRTNPELMASGVGVINIRSNKTVFSSTGATIRHGTFNVSGQSNIIVRNLRFRGLWEFDEGSQNPPDNSPWGYKIQDWDYIDVQNGARNVWIDHCDFEKSYDGIADTKNSADLVTYSWCRLGGDTEGAVARQISYLEKLYQGQVLDARIAATFYKGLRDGAYAGQGIPAQSVADIVAHELPHDKCNLVGASDTATGDIGYLNVTFHHIYYHDCRQRLPRMRFGNAHVFDIYVDNSGIRDGTNMATASTCDAAVFAENNLYQEVADPFPAASGTSPAGRSTQRGSRWILRGVEQPLTSRSALTDPATWTWNTGTKNFTWSVAPAPNVVGLPYSYAADPAEYVRDHLDDVGVIVPESDTDRAKLAEYLVRTAH